MIPIPQYPLYSASLAEYNMDQVSTVQYSTVQYSTVPAVQRQPRRVQHGPGQAEQVLVAKAFLKLSAFLELSGLGH